MAAENIHFQSFTLLGCIYAQAADFRGTHFRLGLVGVSNTFYRRKPGAKLIFLSSFHQTHMRKALENPVPFLVLFSQQQSALKILGVQHGLSGSLK